MIYDGGPSGCVYECSVKSLIGSAELELVLSRELFEERSHKRYADILNAALEGDHLQILDVGGGDGHMAEWWAACDSVPLILPSFLREIRDEKKTATSDLFFHPF